MPSNYETSTHLNVSLPNEVLYRIFCDLPIPALVLLARVSHRFNAVAEHILYSSISIKDVLSKSSPHPWRTKMCCESIIQRSHLVESIRGFHIRWHTDGDLLRHFDFTFTLQKLAEAIHTLSSLESLELWLGPANHSAQSSRPHVIEQILRGSRFPQLINCSLGAEWTKGSAVYSGILDEFLISLCSLRHLKLPDQHAALNIPANALSVLSSFRGSPVTSAFLLPGRPIQYLSLVGQDYDMNQEILARFAYTTVPLRFLDLSAISVRTILLRNIATHLPTIETLKIRLALRHTLHYAMAGIRLLTGLSSVLSSFHQLVHLDLSPTSVGGADAEQELGLCNEWSQACPSLLKITFPSHTEWVIGSDGMWEPV
jgi:hypothetical protein